MTNINNAKDLAQEAPRSPYVRLGGLVILARTIDKCRAAIVGTQGEYGFNDTVDNKLFSFLGITGQDFKSYVTEGHTDEEITKWVKSKVKDKTKEEIEEWSSSFKGDFSYTTDPSKKDWFIGECERLGLDSKTTTMFDMLEVDDKVSFGEVK